MSRAAGLTVPKRGAGRERKGMRERGGEGEGVSRLAGWLAGWCALGGRVSVCDSDGGCALARHPQTIRVSIKRCGSVAGADACSLPGVFWGVVGGRGDRTARAAASRSLFSFRSPRCSPPRRQEEGRSSKCAACLLARLLARSLSLLLSLLVLQVNFETDLI